MHDVCPGGSASGPKSLHLKVSRNLTESLSNFNRVTATKLQCSSATPPRGLTADLHVFASFEGAPRPKRSLQGGKRSQEWAGVMGMFSSSKSKASKAFAQPTSEQQRNGRATPATPQQLQQASAWTVFLY